MSQPSDSQRTKSGRAVHKPLPFDERREELQRQEDLSRQEQRSSDRRRMQQATMDDDLVSPSTPTPAQRQPATSKQSLPTPPMTVFSANPAQIGMSAQHPPAIKPPTRTPASRGPRSSLKKKAKKKQAQDPSQASALIEDSDDSPEAKERRLKAAFNGMEIFLQTQQMKLDRATATPESQNTDGREQPTSWATDRYGMDQPLYRGETHIPDGVQRYISSEPGTVGAWDPTGRDNRSAVGHVGHWVGGMSIGRARQLSGVEQAAGVGEDPMDAMMTSDEEE